MTEVEELVRQSRFIFRGTIARLNASAMPQVPASPSTAVVRVDEVLQAPPALGDLTGTEITVQLAEPEETREGQELLFFANPWLYGEGIAVQEVAHRGVTAEVGALSQSVSAAAEGQAEAQLAARIAEADAVIAGRVHETRPVDGGAVQPVSEHAPEWWEARIGIESVEKGEVAEQSVSVLYPRSMDIIWRDAPKLEVGDHCVWLLRRVTVAEVGAPAYTVTSALDAHTMDQLPRLRRLIAASR